jgi:hypothetical protein
MLLRTALLCLLGATLAVVAVLDVGVPRQCDQADGQLRDKRLGEARGTFLRILDADPSAGCAIAGLDRTTLSECAEALKLREAGRDEEATKAYLTIATRDPAGDAAKCARFRLAASPPSCEAADRAERQGLLTEAHRAYIALVTKPATRTCAATGLAKIRAERCAVARGLEADGRHAAAEKAFTAIATTEPAGACAR